MLYNEEFKKYDEDTLAKAYAYNDFINRLYENGRRIKNITLSLSSLAGLSESINGSYTNEGKTETDLTVNELYLMGQVVYCFSEGHSSCYVK